MKKLFVLSAILIGAASASYAGVSFSINIGGSPGRMIPPPAPVIISHPAPVYYPAQPPVCETPAPVVYNPPAPVCEPQVVLAPPPVVCEPAPRVVITPRPVIHVPAPRVVVRQEPRRDDRHSRDYAYENHRDWNRGNERHDSYNREHRF
jgi:hypothetical protein